MKQKILNIDLSWQRSNTKGMGQILAITFWALLITGCGGIASENISIEPDQSNQEQTLEPTIDAENAPPLDTQDEMEEENEEETDPPITNPILDLPLTETKTIDFRIFSKNGAQVIEYLSKEIGSEESMTEPVFFRLKAYAPNGLGAYPPDAIKIIKKNGGTENQPKIEIKQWAGANYNFIIEYIPEFEELGSRIDFEIQLKDEVSQKSIKNFSIAFPFKQFEIQHQQFEKAKIKITENLKEILLFSFSQNQTVFKEEIDLTPTLNKELDFYTYFLEVGYYLRLARINLSFSNNCSALHSPSIKKINMSNEMFETLAYDTYLINFLEFYQINQIDELKTDLDDYSIKVVNLLDAPVIFKFIYSDQCPKKLKQLGPMILFRINYESLYQYSIEYIYFTEEKKINFISN